MPTLRCARILRASSITPFLKTSLGTRIVMKAPMTCPIIRIDTNQGISGFGEVRDGGSKTYAMTGWRLGFGIMPAPMATRVAKLQTNSTSCTCSFTQIAGIEALRGPQDAVEKMRKAFDMMCERALARTTQGEALD